MDELIKLVQAHFGTGIVSAGIIGLLWIGGKFIKPGIVQADANAALFGQMTAQLETLTAEVRTLKRQLVILEKLALKAGIDVEQAYKDAGIYDENS